MREMRKVREEKRERFNLLRVGWQNHQCKCSRYEHLPPLTEIWIKLTRPQGHPLILTDIKCLTARNWRLLPTAHKYRGNLDVHRLPAVLGVILPHVLDEVHLLQTFVSWRPRYMLGSATIKKKNKQKKPNLLSVLRKIHASCMIRWQH